MNSLKYWWKKVIGFIFKFNLTYMLLSIKYKNWSEADSLQTAMEEREHCSFFNQFLHDTWLLMHDLQFPFESRTQSEWARQSFSSWSKVIQVQPFVLLQNSKHADSSSSSLWRPNKVLFKHSPSTEHFSAIKSQLLANFDSIHCYPGL